ncbi:MAG: MOSC N-terminal beta barrel domain-containing protein [Oceanospirillaceae bacterium]
MSNAYVESLTFYPLKSAAGIDCDSAEILNAGIKGDRRFMLTKMDGRFVTGRTHPKITAITCEYAADNLILKHASCDDLILEQHTFSQQYYPTEVWGTKFLGQGCGYAVDQWISAIFDEPLRILFFGDNSNREVADHDAHQVAFADGFPLLITNTHSLDHLNQRLLAPVSMAAFRPNITISGVPAWAEDEWAQIKIGEVIFDLPKPCGRCIFTTVDPTTAIHDSKSEPVKTLGTYRKQQAQDGDVIFGENMLVVKPGIIRVGDKVEVLKTKAKPEYIDSWSFENSRLSQQLALASSSKQAGNMLLRCVQIIDETEDVKTFKFVADPICRFSYLPGQFITLQPVINDQKYPRCYTLSSSPSTPDIISITVKRVTQGVVSNWLHDSFKVGSSINSSNASGVFHLAAQSLPKLLLLSAGSGITPMLSIVRYIADLALDMDVHFHHSAKTAADLICFNELKSMANGSAKLSLSCNFTRQDAIDDYEVVNSSGRFGPEILQAFCSDVLEREVLVCGPDGFMDSVSNILTELKLPATQYHQESFVIDSSTNNIEQGEDSKASKGPYKLKFLQSGLEMEVDADQTILDAAESLGIYPDYSCLAGICGSCNSTLINGEIHAPDALALDEEDKANGEFLPCCSYARSDLEIDL